MKHLIFISAILLLSNCFKESLSRAKRIHGAKWTGTYAVPAANIDIGLDDAIEFANSVANVGTVSGNVIYLAYTKTIRSLKGDQLVNLNPQSYSFTAQLTSQEKADLAAGTTKINRSFSNNYVHTYEFDSIRYMSGSLDFLLTNQYQHTANVKVKFPDLRKNGQSPFQEFTIGPNSSESRSIDISGSILDLTKGGPGYNHFRCEIEMQYTNSGNGFTGSESITLNVGLTNQRFDRIWGYFDVGTMLQAEDSVSMEIFGSGSSVNATDLYFANPNITVFLSNETGIPANIHTSDVFGSTSGKAPEAITGFPVTRITGGGIRDSVKFDQNNSNIKTVINNRPRYITFKTTAEANPGGKTQRNYLDHNARLAVKVWVELPFDGWAGRIEATDSTPMNMNLEGNEKYLDWITFRFEYTNGLPLEAAFQGYFADSSGKILDSIFSPARNFADAAEVDANGNVIKSVHDVYYVTYDRERIAGILSTKQFILKATLKSSRFNSGLVAVRLTQEQRFNVKLGVHTKLSADETF